MTEQRPTLPEAEYRVRQWLAQHLWGSNYVGRVIARLMREYDDRGRALGITAAAAQVDVDGQGDVVTDLAEDTPPAEPHCHNPRHALQCGLCAVQPARAGGVT